MLQEPNASTFFDTSTRKLSDNIEPRDKFSKSSINVRSKLVTVNVGDSSNIFSFYGNRTEATPCESSRVWSSDTRDTERLTIVSGCPVVKSYGLIHCET